MRLEQLREAVEQGVTTYFMQVHNNETGRPMDEYFVFEYHLTPGSNPHHLQKVLSDYTTEKFGQYHSNMIHRWSGAWKDLDEVRAKHDEEFAQIDRWIMGKQWDLKDAERNWKAFDAIMAKNPNIHFVNETNESVTDESVNESEKRWKQTSMSPEEATKEFGADNVRVKKGALRNGDDMVEVFVEDVNESYDAAAIGRKLQAMAQVEKNDVIANAMANLSDYLEDYGTSFSAKNMKDLEQKTGLPANIIQALIKRAVNYKEPVAEGRMSDMVIHDSETLSKEEFAKKHGKELADEYYESVNEDESKYTDKEIKMAKGIAFDKRYKAGDMTAAVGHIEDIADGLSDHPEVKAALKAANESKSFDKELLEVWERIAKKARLDKK